MNNLTEIFNKFSLSQKVIDMNDLLTSVEEIHSEIQIDNLAVLTIINWIRNNPGHSFPKRKKGWINTISQSQHLNCVRIFNSQTRRCEKYYINGEKIFGILLSRGYLYQIKTRIYCDSRQIENQSEVYCCGKRKTTLVEERPSPIRIKY